MTKFTKELIDDYANKLLIGLSDEENKMVLDEFNEIDKTIDIINNIEGLNEVEPYSWCLDNEIDFLDEDVVEESSSMSEILSNCDKHTSVEIEVPKVVNNE